MRQRGQPWLPCATKLHCTIQRWSGWACVYNREVCFCGWQEYHLQVTLQMTRQDIYLTISCLQVSLVSTSPAIWRMRWCDNVTSAFYLLFEKGLPCKLGVFYCAGAVRSLHDLCWCLDLKEFNSGMPPSAKKGRLLEVLSCKHWTWVNVIDSPSYCRRAWPTTTTWI